MNRINAQEIEGFSSKFYYIFIYAKSNCPTKIITSLVHLYTLSKRQRGKRERERKKTTTTKKLLQISGDACPLYFHIPNSTDSRVHFSIDITPKDNEGVWRKWWEQVVCMCADEASQPYRWAATPQRSALNSALKDELEATKEGTWATHTLAPEDEHTHWYP